MSVKIFEIGLEAGDYVGVAQKIKSEIKSLNEEQKKMKGTTQETSRTFINNAATIKGLKGDYNALEKQIIDSNNQSKKTIDITKQVNKEMSLEVNTINEANQQIAKLNKVKKSLNVNNVKEKALIDQINKKIDSNTTFVKQNSSAIEKQKINIGNYQGAIGTLNPAMGAMVGNLIRIKEALVLQKTAMLGSTAATNLSSKALRLFKIALISTGIGAIVVALGSLIAYFAKTQEGSDKISIVFKAIGATVDVLVDRFIAVGKIMTKVFSQSLFKTVKDLTGAFSGMGDEMQRELKIAIELEQATQRLRDLEISQIAVTAERKVAIELLRTAAKNELDTYDSRIEKLKAAQSMERQTMKEQVANSTERLRIAEIDLAQATSKAEHIEEVEKLRAEVSLKALQSLKLNRTLESEIQSLQKRERSEQAKWAKQKQTEREKEERAKLKEKEAEELRKEEIEQAKADELTRLKDFEAKKTDLKNAIKLQNAATDEEREMLKLTQENEKHLLELEDIKLKEDEKNELKKLILEQYNNDVAELTDAAAEKRAEKQKLAATSELNFERQKSNAKIQIAGELASVLKGVLGESLAAQIAGIALDAVIEIAKMKIATSAAQQLNLAEATAISAFDPSAIPRALGRNVALGASSKIQQTLVLASAGVSGLGAVLKLSKGGYLEGDSHEQGGIPFTVNGQSGFEAEGGEAVINKESTAMFRPMLSAMNVAGGGVAFDSGGIASVNPSIIDTPLEQNAIKVINVARDTIDIANDEIKVENLANL